MLTELSLNVLDIVENSIIANATLIEISIFIFHDKDILEITIKDNGNGMDENTMKKAIDPFYTTRETRNVGFGLSFFKLSSELSKGTFNISSEIGKALLLVLLLYCLI